MKKIATIGLALGLLLGIVPVAYAQNVYLGGDTETSATVGGMVDTDLDTSIDVGVGVTGSTETEGDTSDNASGSVQIGTSGTGGASIVITRASASSGNTATITTPTTVTSNADLSVYASTIVRGDGNVNGAELSDAAVSLAYKVHAKLFGIFSVLMPATATVHASGETTVEYPWYAFFATFDSASLESDVEAATAATVSANANTAFSVSTQAQLLDEVYAAMKSNLVASLAAEAAATASAR
ncbi:hypothetical protein A2853_02280 [Candidatus Kaiserbacteria bacterium RIFCSPHIGHO2_01_FULL_55_17]|uniref:Uncharacterized protein n=1 Tax=Candidatus Kaiserbacteria bacterium RIFCSPHIGHO2_01_FULL_55_17 TaxID=1798484 RepID=A0A1F6D7A8_9BACT|nr:MAG: hypothetical protein A2853_02280 [Candidatus Kaiserbacteria bacterium RIFCSPHIGHO2_01_FULL_55_17]